MNIMFKKVLIANRGAIAVRIIRTLKKMGIASVAVYNEADRDSLHVQQADEAWSLGEGTAAQTYLNQAKLFDIIHKTNVDAVHPGYGFLSENPAFVKACEQAGIIFIGPTTEQIITFGLKHKARELAKQQNIPLLPGSDLIEDLEQALQVAKKIGYPVMLKSTAGGGGIGMQLCWDETNLKKSFNKVRRLSQNNFSHDGIFIEKFIQYARHIEVQIFGNGQGDAIALGERDCSTQRRNQKVIEETPAPNLADDTRFALQTMARDLACAVQYRSAGTIEYIYDQQTDQFYFLEMNTRLQVEHGVTEQIYNIDLVEWMVKLAAGSLSSLPKGLQPKGHAIQLRIYAEDTNKGFQPAAGQLTQVSFPEEKHVRVEHWLIEGIEVSAYFDPMLAKLIVTAEQRDAALVLLAKAIKNTSLYGIETNINYLRAVLNTEPFIKGEMYTRYLEEFVAESSTIDVLQAGTMTTIQSYPGRTGYWDVGVPPSGPFDNLSFRLANQLLGNHIEAAGLEITLNGPVLKFHCATKIVLAGANLPAKLDDKPVDFWSVIDVCAGQTLSLGQVIGAGARTYLCIQGGIHCPDYLGSKATFTLGMFGGHVGRALRTGDVLHFAQVEDTSKMKKLPDTLIPQLTKTWQLRVTYGPHGAPDFFTEQDIDTLFSSQWEVHYNSSRTGIRLIGPKPEWARSTGGEAGMHPSNIHDNAYAIGTVDFTGDMPVILGPDGPSLGGFVCPVTVIKADLWKLGQVTAGDNIQFLPVSIDTAVSLDKTQNGDIDTLKKRNTANYSKEKITTAVLKTLGEDKVGTKVVYRSAGDGYLLIEYGPLILDIALRFRVHNLLLWLQEKNIPGVIDITPGIRSLQIHYDSHIISLNPLLYILEAAEYELADNNAGSVPARIVHLPLSWDDQACHMAVEKYMQSVRRDAPWCPDNIEFIRRINGLKSVEQVKEIVFSASYLVMGLGDVYLGAPVATPLDPRHRLVTTKYNPARTWTADNSVGIGGSYLCIYGMEGPGGYQFIGRTLQMWNRYHKTDVFTQPWLLRFFDQIRFYEVSAQELLDIRQDFPRGQYPINIEETEFSLSNYQAFLSQESQSIKAFEQKRAQAFDAELQRWITSGQINFHSEQSEQLQEETQENLPENSRAIESSVAGSVWEVLVKPGESVNKDQPLVIVESMKMEIQIISPIDGVIHSLSKQAGEQVMPGQTLLVLEENKA